jgi:hypothetical protein
MLISHGLNKQRRERERERKEEIPKSTPCAALLILLLRLYLLLGTRPSSISLYLFFPRPSIRVPKSNRNEIAARFFPDLDANFSDRQSLSLSLSLLEEH